MAGSDDREQLVDERISDDLQAAVAAVRAAPSDDGAWDALEALAGQLDRLDEVAALYRELIGEQKDGHALAIGERAVRFHEEWLGGDREGLERVLWRVLEIDASSEWALQRLSVVLTVAERWDDLLALYDRALAAASGARREQLLEEAAQVAKDVAGKPDEAVGYLQSLYEIRPDDAQLAVSLERLLERHERWRDLIALWESRLEAMTDDAARDIRARIAECWLDPLAAPVEALESARVLLEESGDDDARPLAIIERVATHASTGPGERERALELLRGRYESTSRPRDVIRVLEAVLEVAAVAEKRALHAEIGRRLEELGDDAAALEHYAALLALDPASAVTQEQLRQVAQRAGRFERYAEGAAAAAEASDEPDRVVELYAEAARARLEIIGDAEGAIELYRKALDVEAIKPADTLALGRRLHDLLSRAGRSAERLDVLERLGAVEDVASSRRAILSDAAHLAAELGDVDRALASWRRLLDDDPKDLVAITETVELLERDQRWPELIEALGHRVSISESPVHRRADRVSLAEVCARELGDVDRAVEAWRKIAEDHGEDGEVVDALAKLLGEGSRWSELAELLERATRRDVGRVNHYLAVLGDVYREHLDDAERGREGYARALRVDPRHEGARAGLTALLEHGEHRAHVAESLAAAYRECGEWDRFLSLVDDRLEGASDARRLDILREAAEIRERELGDREGALAAVARALPLAPRDRGLEESMMRLCRATGAFATAIAAYREAAAAVADDPYEVSRLRYQEGVLSEQEVGDPAAALEAYLEVAGRSPADPDAARAVTRLGVTLERFEPVAAVFVANARARGMIDETCARTLEEGVGPELVRAVEAAAQDGTTPQASLAAELWWLIARWHRDRLEDREAARGALERMLEADGTRLDGLRALAEIQAGSPDAAYYETLRRIADLDRADLAAAYGAARVAADELADGEKARASASVLFGRATAAWRAGAKVEGAPPPEEMVAWCAERLADDAVATGDPAAAVDLLVDAARLPFQPAARRDLRVRAADIAAAEVGDRGLAVEMLRGQLAQTPDDGEVIEKLAALYEAEGRIPELLSLRQHELALDPPAERKLALRLDIARLVGDIEARGGRIEALRANLDEQPGHVESIAAIAEVLGGKGRPGDLADLLASQAKRLEEQEDGPPAAELWAKVAAIAENELGDVPRALDAHRRVVSLAPTSEALAALARLHRERGEPESAARWLEQQLAGVSADERTDIVLDLGRVYVEAEQPERAIAALEKALEEDARSLALRELLLDLYRQTQAWEPLADLLTESLPHVPDEERAASFAREAVEIYRRRLDRPDRAVPALERAVELVPDDNAMKLMLARGLRMVGRTAEARDALAALIEGFGRRRSPERAAVHVELAQVHRADGDLDAAFAELDTASKMDVGNAHVLRALAQLAKERGQLDEAERSYRALLLVVRRQVDDGDESAVGASEVLFELSRIAREKGEGDQADELVESALAAAAQSDVEVRRFLRTLRVEGDGESIRQALERRIEAAETSASRVAHRRALADLFDERGDGEAALTVRLAALDEEADHPDLHDKARAGAAALGATDRYVEAIESILSRTRREGEQPTAAQLLLRAAAAVEEDADELSRARELYRRVEALGEMLPDALVAIARTSGKLGDTDEQARAFEALTDLASDDAPSPDQADALYRLAALQLDIPERLESGLKLLRRALDAEPRFAEAGAILRAAAASHPEHDELLALYERAARATGDEEMLLDFLDHRSRRPGVTVDEIREAVDLATARDEGERAEGLLSRAVEAARERGELAGASWSALALAERRIAADRLEEARDLLFEVADVADVVEPGRAFELGSALAEKAAGEPGSLRLAAEVYEFLRAREPAARRIWEPLLEVYRKLGETDALQQLVQATLPHLVAAEERNVLRMQQAQLLADEERADAAAELLRDALLDDPDHLEAGALLERVLRDAGREEELADVLRQRFEDACERGHAETAVEVAKSLGALVARSDNAHEAATVYRQALAVAPQSGELLARLLEQLGEDADPRERGELLERLLVVETGARAAELARELIELWTSLGDDEAALRSLETGHRVCPEDDGLRDSLERAYRERGRWADVSALVRADAGRRERSDERVARYREAAAVEREQLGDAQAAAEVLLWAQKEAPDDDDVLAELVEAYAAAKNLDGAIAALGEALEGDGGGARRARLLVQRSELWVQMGADDRAIADLEEALAEGGEVSERLVEALEAARQRAAERGDADAERAATTRLVELLMPAGEEERARRLLFAWIERAPHDVAALHKLREIEAAAEHWEGVVAACSRLVELEEGEAQIEAALALADAAERCDAAGQARAGLEYASRAQPEDERVRALLKRIYEQSGAHRELAGILAQEGDSSEDAEHRVACYQRAAELYSSELGDPAAAVAPALALHELRPDDHGIVLLVSDVLTAAGRIDEVVEILDPAIRAHKRRSPDLAALQRRMAHVAAAAGDRDTQLAWLKKAFDVDRKNGEIAAELAHLATELGDYDLALKPLRAISLMENPGPVTRVMALLWEAKIEHARGNRAKAELWAKKALREDPEYQEAHEFLAELES